MRFTYIDEFYAGRRDALAYFALALLLFGAARVAAQDALKAEAVILERGPHHQIVQTASGGHYTELACGMNFLKNGDWVPAQETIVVGRDGYGVADQGLHSARFAPSITDSPAVIYTDPDGNIFQTRCLGLAYLDYSSGASVLFCETKESIGVVEGGTVTYADAFTDDVKGDIRVVYKKGSFESDILIRAQLPSPRAYSLNPDTCRLQVWH